jgi:hypothetical protein
MTALGTCRSEYEDDLRRHFVAFVAHPTPLVMTTLYAHPRLGEGAVA